MMRSKNQRVCLGETVREMLALALVAGLRAAPTVTSRLSAGLASAVEVAPGVMMPYLSIGHSDSSTSTSQKVAALWLAQGGRGLDTAWSYHNQDEVGAAVKASSVPRSEIFVRPPPQPLTPDSGC